MLWWFLSQPILAHRSNVRFFDPDTARGIDTTIDDSTAKNADLVESLLSTDFNRRQNGLSQDIRHIMVPSLLIHGDFDPIPVASSEDIQGFIPDAELVVIADAGHFPFIE